MTADGILSHDELLTLAHKVEAAAADDDRERLAASTTRLFDELVAHLRAERPQLLRIPLREERLLARGQERVVDLLLDLALCAETEPSTDGSCHPDRLAEQLFAQLRVQAEDERLAGLARIGAGPHGEDQ